MFFGTLAALAHGAALPAFTVIFGDFVSVFVNQAITSSLEKVFVLNNFTAFTCNSPFNFTYYGQTVSGITGGGLDCSYVINSTTTYNEFIMACFSSTNDCLSDSDFISRIDILAFIFIGIGVGVFLCGTVQVALFQAACERQVKKIRLAFYNAIMRQEVGWFDANPTGELASRLTE